MDEDWRGIDLKWLARIVRERRFDELPAYLEATRPRRPRPVRWYALAPPADDPGIEILATELGTDQHCSASLDLHEVVVHFDGDLTAAMDVVQRLLAVGYARRECPALGVTDRYLCRSADDRAELRRQLTAWLSSD